MSKLAGAPIDGVEVSLGERGGSDASSRDAIERQAPPNVTRRRRHARAPRIDKEWYSKTEAARYLGVAEITVTRYLQKGTLHAQRLPTPDAKPRSSKYDYGRLRIHKSELDRYLESVERTPNQQVTQVEVTRYETMRESGESGPSTAGRGEELMTRQEAALQLGVSWRTIDRYIKNRVLRLAGYFRCPDSYTRAHVYRAEVEQLLRGLEPSEGIKSRSKSSDTRNASY